MLKKTISITVILSLLLILQNIAFAKNKAIKILDRQSAEDVTQDYFSRLLERSLEQGYGESPRFELINATSLTQGRVAQLLRDNFLDVFWMGTSIEREEQFHAIKIPLMKGLLGYRVSVVQKQNLTNFISLTEVQFKTKIACQAEHWPDTKILQYNKYNVNPVAGYNAMFGMVSKGRCDYFPRAIFEGYGELDIAKKTFSNLVMLDEILLYYPYPIYFFVNKEHIELGSVIEKGLEDMIDSGEFDAFMQNHKITKHIFPLIKWKDKRIFYLENPFLSNKTDLTNTRYWVLPFDHH